MKIETVEELAEQLADWIGIYGGCKNIRNNGDGCNYDKFNNPFCCRSGFVQAISERMIEAVENEKKLKQVDLI